jgi:hypothetical protein
MSTGFEIWDDKTHNTLQFDRLEDAIVAIRGLVERSGADVVDGLSLDAVSADGATRMTLAANEALRDLISTSAAAR